MSRMEMPVAADAVTTAPRVNPKRELEAAGQGALFALFAFGEAAQEGRMRSAVKAAQLFCIGFAFVVPVLMLWPRVF